MGAHDQLGEQAAAYALGALTPAEAQAFETHLAGCATCSADVRTFAPVVCALAYLAPAAAPRRQLREKIARSASSTVR